MKSNVRARSQIGAKATVSNHEVDSEKHQNRKDKAINRFYESLENLKSSREPDVKIEVLTYASTIESIGGWAIKKFGINKPGSFTLVEYMTGKESHEIPGNRWKIIEETEGWMVPKLVNANEGTSKIPLYIPDPHLPLELKKNMKNVLVGKDGRTWDKTSIVSIAGVSQMTVGAQNNLSNMSSYIDSVPNPDFIDSITDRMEYIAGISPYSESETRVIDSY